MAETIRVWRRSPFLSGFENQRHEDAEDHCRRDAAGGGGQASGQNAQPALFRHSLGNALRQGVAKARQGHGGPGTAPVGDGLVHAQRTEDDACHHIARQDACGGELRLVDQNLADGAQDTAAEERVERGQ